jgi:hypothetical protein
VRRGSRLMSASALERRVEALEAATGAGGGCERCVGTLIIVGNALNDTFVSASWNGEPIGEEELLERQAERECPRCGRRIDPGEASEIEVGGRWR